MVRDELQRGKLKGKARRRAWRFEKRLREGRGGSWSKKIFRGDKRESSEREGDFGLEGGKESFLREQEREAGGVSAGGKRKESGLRKLNGGAWKSKGRKDGGKSTSRNTYNRWYRMIKGTGIPDYLKKGWGESRWRSVIRFRMLNEIREERYWEEEQRNQCRLCSGERETWEHVWEKCRVEGGTGLLVGRGGMGTGERR